MKAGNAMRSTRRAARGVAAVEFAIMLPILIILLSAPLYIGRVMWYYTAAQKAAHDAAQYLSTVPDAEMRSPGLISSSTAVAGDLVAAELADLNGGGAYPPSVTIQCDGVSCDGYVAPTVVRVHVRMRVQDPFFGTAFGGDEGILVSADSQMLYMGSQ